MTDLAIVVVASEARRPMQRRWFAAAEAIHRVICLDLRGVGALEATHPATEFHLPSYRTKRRVRHAAEDMFNLVADVERYPEFLPLCQSLVVRRRKPLENGRELIVAEMRVGYKAIRETFTSRIELDPVQRTILVEYLEGPFRSLENRWSFEPDPDSPQQPSSTISFFITYEFKSRMLGLLMGSMVDGAFRRFAEAFEQRADLVYGAS